MRHAFASCLCLAIFLSLPAVSAAGWREPDRDDRVVFFATAAHFDREADRWVLPIHGWIYEEARSRVRKKVVEGLLEGRHGLVVTPDVEDNFDRRVNLFLSDNQRWKRVRVRIGTGHHSMPASAPNGHFRGTVRLGREEAGRLAAEDGAITFEALRPRSSGVVYLFEPVGVSVISDIDDTVKITEVDEPRELWRRTLLADFEAVPGMAELYRAWAARGARFHFVSSSPWQLHDPLLEFMQRDGFPPATFHLKSVRLKDRTILNLFKEGLETKPDEIAAIIESHPGRTYVLVGDSGEQDPEAYAEIYRRYPEAVVRIYIRNVTDAKRDDERFRHVFADVPPERWELFTEPATLATGTFLNPGDQ